MNDHKQMALELMRGAYDCHVHTLPSAFPRELDSFELVREAEAAGMAGVMLKSHYEPTAGRALLTNRQSGVKAKAYGGIVLNWPVGGLNPYAVENNLKMGGRIVWMPTRDSANSLLFGDMPGDFFDRPGITIWDERKNIKPVVLEILSIVMKYGASLATGHLCCEESYALCVEGRKLGVRMILTHPDFSRTKVPLETQVELARAGVLIEKCWLNIAGNMISKEKMAESIRTIGPESVFLSTDRGQAGAPRPVPEMLRFIETLLDEGFTGKEIQNMTCTVPKSILD